MPGLEVGRVDCTGEVGPGFSVYGHCLWQGSGRAVDILKQNMDILNQSHVDMPNFTGRLFCEAWGLGVCGDSARI